VSLLSFGVGGGSGVGRGSIGGVADGSGLDAEARLAQLGVGIGGRVDDKLIGGPIGVVADLLARQARPW